MKCYECESHEELVESMEMRDLDGVAMIERLVYSCAACGAEMIGDRKPDVVFSVVANELALLDRRVRAETFSRWETGTREYPQGSRRLLRLAVRDGPQSWPYDIPTEDSDAEPLKLKYNSAKNLVRV